MKHSFFCARWIFSIVFSITFYLIPTHFVEASTSTRVLISIAPSEMSESIGKDGMPLIISPRLTFSGLEDSIAEIELTSSTKGAPVIGFATNTSFGLSNTVQPFQFTIPTPTSTNSGIYAYQWRILFSSTGSNVNLGLPFKLTLQVTDTEAEITKPYAWNDAITKISAASPLKHIALPRFELFQREDEHSETDLEIESIYPRTLEQVPAKSSVIRYKSLSTLHDELVSTSTLIIKSGTTAKSMVLPALPIGIYTASISILDQTATEFLIVLPRYPELAAIFLIPAGLTLAWTLTRKKQ